MEPTPRQLEIYAIDAGSEPFEDWMAALKDQAARGAIRARLERVEDGNFGDHRSVGDGVYELRINFGPGYRVYYLRDGEKIIVLLCGGVKDTQFKDVAKAKTYAADYWRRK